MTRGYEEKKGASKKLILSYNILYLRKVGYYVEIIVHYPGNEENIKELERKISEVHICAVKSYIKNLSCPKEQKMQLIDTILNK